jgi:signal transduction histidine kinase
MELVRDKLILLTLCLALFLPGHLTLYAVVPLIAAVTASALSSLLERDRLRLVIFVASTLACMIEPSLVFFLPLLCFDLFGTRFRFAVLLAALPLLLLPAGPDLPQTLQLALLAVLAWFLKSRALELQQVRREVIELRDAAVESQLRLERKNKDLLERQETEISLATLNERSRIAREIHDQVGHLLTRAILQIGAILAAKSESSWREPLQTVRDTLSESMDQIRRSVHGLHDDAIDLKPQLEQIVRSFTYCPVSLISDLEQSPESACTVAFLAITREALANLARHSQATWASVTVREHPGFYQLIIRDNGIGLKASPFTEAIGQNRSVGRASGGGIGLKNMVERVETLGGQINFRSERGLVIFITVPKPAGRAGPPAQTKAGDHHA